MRKSTTTTPDPELSIPLGPQQEEGPLSGHGRGEVAGCPTGLTDAEQAQTTQRPGGGGAPGTGATDTETSEVSQTSEASGT
jgi:hypothetical protein